MLHVAPESCLETRFRARLGGEYVTADLQDPSAMVRMDVTAIPFDDETFDVIYCSHVFEHVSNDRQAMREFLRVLRPDGWAVLLVPITSDETYEDPTIVEPERRLEAFGQEDHVRRYGPDYVERLRETGFDVLVVTPSDLVTAAQAVRMGLTPASGEIYYCTKRLGR